MSNKRAVTSGICANVTYARRGLLKPTPTLPTGHHRWRLDDIERQLRALRERGEQPE